MSAFKEFLARSSLDDRNIDATAETVSFTNKNGKKFSYPIDDLEECLLAIWQSGEAVKSGLNGDWKYEESKFRKAFGAAFASQRSNSVASNLGSQTPNTVRCLELYAYFKLNKTPTSALDNPDILSSENLDPLFYGPDLREEFHSWLSNREKDGKTLSKKSVESYTGAIAGLLSDSAGKNLFRISSPRVFGSLRERVQKEANFTERDNTGNRMYSAALNHYAAFLVDRVGQPSSVAGSKVSFSLIPADFAKALVRAGFKMTN